MDKSSEHETDRLAKYEALVAEDGSPTKSRLDDVDIMEYVMAVWYLKDAARKALLATERAPQRRPAPTRPKKSAFNPFPKTG